MRIAVTGATGLIGRKLVAALLGRGDVVTVLSRNAASASAAFGRSVEVHEWASPESTAPPAAAIRGADAVIHLMGEPVSQRWTQKARNAIMSSRVLPTRNLVAALTELDDAQRPAVLVAQSATGYYGPHSGEVVDESTPAGDDFLASVVVNWEREAHNADGLLRVACTRTGVVLDAQGGALSKMLPIFKLGIGGPVGGGRQYVPWIHVDDVVGALIATVDDTSLSGAINLTAPGPATNAELSHALGRVLHRPAFWPVPGFMLKLLYGGMSTLVLTGQRAVPARLLASGFAFRHPELDEALADVVKSA